MNVLTACELMNPLDIEEECAQFSIDDVITPFSLHNITRSGKRYTFGFWIKSDTAGSITVCRKQIQTTTEWGRHVVKYTAEGPDLEILFNTAGVYYICRPKLEEGTEATSWTPAPEDADERVTTAESLIKQLADSISMLVTDENGASLMTQTADGGWTFSMAETSDAVNSLSQQLDELQKETGDVNATVTILQQTVTDLGETLDYVRIGTWENEPCIELGESDSDYSLMITNTRILFRVGSNAPTQVTTYGLVTENIEVKGEIKQGGFVQVLTSNGGWGLLWKGVN